MPSCNTYCLTWVSLTLDVGYLFTAAPASSRLLQQSAATAPYLGRGVSPHHHPSWPWTLSSSSRPSCACAATAPWMWSCHCESEWTDADVTGGFRVAGWQDADNSWASAHTPSSRTIPRTAHRPGRGRSHIRRGRSHAVCPCILQDKWPVV